MSLLFELFYLIGFTPWDREDTPVMRRLRDVAEGAERRAPGRALDLGCGMGRHAIYLAQQGWQVTGVDAVNRALRVARRRAAERQASVDFIQGDVTRLDRAGIVGPFDLLLDSGCFHGLADEARHRYGESVTRVAKPGAQFLLFAFARGQARLGPRGADRADIERSLTGWEIVSVAPETMTLGMRRGDQVAAACYWLRRGAG